MNNSIQFGTDGIRGRADTFPFLPHSLKKLGKAIYACAVNSKKHQSPIKILMVGDTRESYEAIKSALCTGLLSAPVLIIDAGILSTPAACSLMQHDSSYDLGIVISASHNPYYDNGIKILVPGGGKLTPHDEEIIANYFNTIDNDTEKVVGSIEQHDLFDQYQQNIFKFYGSKFLTGTKIVIDCANGATSTMATPIFMALGAEVITLSAFPNGTNINDHCGALHPEALQKAVVQHGAYAGFAFDGDGDRITAVTGQGEVRDGDDILWILASSTFYQSLDTLVGTVMTNSGLEKALAQEQKKLVRVSVGDKHILRKLDEQGLLLGGEPSGHIILRDYLPICDGIFVALRLLDVLISTNNHAMNSFTHFPQALLNIPVIEKKDLSQGTYACIIAHYQAALQDGRILVRYSGTENILRIMTEASNEHEAQEIAQQLGNELQLQLR